MLDAFIPLQDTLITCTCDVCEVAIYDTYFPACFSVYRNQNKTIKHLKAINKGWNLHLQQYLSQLTQLYP